MSLDIVLHITRIILLIELVRSFWVMLKRYSDYEMSKLQKMLDDLDEINKRNEK